MKKFLKVLAGFAGLMTIGVIGVLAQSAPSGLGTQYYPPWYSGYTPTPLEWQYIFSNKMDYNSSGCPISIGCTGATTPAAARTNLGVLGLEGGTLTGDLTVQGAFSAETTADVGTAMTVGTSLGVGTTLGVGGKITGAAGTTGAASLNLPHGDVPSAPVNGDIWTTSAGFYVRINGTTTSFLPVGGAVGEKMTFITPDNSTASINLPHGTAPSAPADGDVWSTTAGLFMRINGTTWGPFFAGGITQTAKITAMAPGTSAGFNLTPGSAPGTPVNGDLWTTSTGLYARINGASQGPYASLAGGTYTGKITAATPGTNAGLNLPHGSAPSSPANGDIWTTTTGLFARINSATVGPYFSTAGGTFSGKITTPIAGLNVPPGSNGSPSNGDIWTESTGLYARISGASIGPYFSTAGGTFSGKVTAVTPASGTASINLPHGDPPSAPSNGDVWTTTAGMYVQTNGTTIGPLVAASTFPMTTDFGDGSDGAGSCTGTETLTKDVYYSSLSIGSSCVLTTDGYRIFVNGTLTFASGGKIKWVGNDGTAGTEGGGQTTGGAAHIAQQLAGNPAAGGYGGASSTTTGANGDGANLGRNGGGVGAGGNGGTGGYAGGTGGLGNNSDAYEAPQPRLPWGLYQDGSTIARTTAGSSGAGGGAGGGNSAQAGGAGGSGGSGGGTIIIVARSIDKTNMSADAIDVRGGSGGNGGAGTSNANKGGGGGGSGGGGGAITIVYHDVTGSTVTNAFNVSGGGGAAGGNGSQTGGDGGRAGWSGRVTLINLVAGTITMTTPVAPPAAGTHSGTTGGTATTNSKQVDF